MSYNLYAAQEHIAKANKKRKALQHTVIGFEDSYTVARIIDLKTILANDELDNIDTEFDNEYNAVVDNIYVKTFYNTNEDI